MTQIISLHNEVELISDLADDTVILIHHTKIVPAIKMLVDAYDILYVTLSIERQFEDFEHRPPWDAALHKDLNSIRCELMTRFAASFKPPTLLPPYYSKMGNLFSLMNLRLSKRSGL